MDHIEAATWTRHFDSLLWQVTSIFATAIGALIAYSYANFDVAISLAGLFFTILPVYFGASFRELRKNVSIKLDPELKEALQLGRQLYQWQVFVSIFIVFECLWTWLLIKNMSEYLLMWVIIGISVLFLTIWFSSVGKITFHKDEKSITRQVD